MTTTSYTFAKTDDLPGWNGTGGTRSGRAPGPLGLKGPGRTPRPDYIGACAPMSTKPKTLLIDDDEGMRDTLTAILRRDYTVLTAPSGEAGLETLARVDVDLMLLDVRLPNIGGLDVLKITKEQHPRIEAIVISAVS